MNLAYAVERLYQTGWSLLGEWELDRLPDGRAFPSVSAIQRVTRALEKAALSEERVAEFERAIDAADEELQPLRAFVLPAGTAKAAAFHLARTVCRRAERSVVHLAHEAEVHELFIVYLNRLSDLLFTFARLANHRAGIGDMTW